MSDISKIYSEFSIPLMRDHESGPTSAEIAMAKEIACLRAEVDHLRRVGMGRPSAELHEASLAEMRSENERLRSRVELLERISRCSW